MRGQDVLSLSQFDEKSISLLFQETDRIIALHKAGKPVPQALKGRVISLLFFEPSSRTFGSFSSAVQRLGGSTVEVRETSNLSLAKGESLEDTVRTFECYSEGMVVRHAIVGAVKRVADAVKIPVINAGDGGGEHPTQTLLDLYTIHKKKKRLDNLVGVFGVDPLHSRTHHSLIRGLSMYKGNTVYMLSDNSLRLDPVFVKEVEKNGIKVVEIDSEDDIPKDADFWYWNRLQKERFIKEGDYEHLRSKFVITPELLKKKGNKDMLVMDPLPRVGEITEDVDADPRAVYFEQMRNGLFVRMALLSLIFSV